MIGYNPSLIDRYVGPKIVAVASFHGRRFASVLHHLQEQLSIAWDIALRMMNVRRIGQIFSELLLFEFHLDQLPHGLPKPIPIAYSDYGGILE